MISVTDVRVVYSNGFEALKSVSLVVRRGEIVALIGRSGAGKSTLLRCLNGLQSVASGTILVDGADVSRMNPAQLADLRRRAGFIWQESNLVKRLTVFKNVLTGRLGHGRTLASLVHVFDRHDREMALRSLERVHLVHRAGQRADRLSGGEKQRVAIARALAQEPRILLADEPVASLDNQLAGHVMDDLVQVAREEGVPTLISLHDIALARRCADRVVGLAEGRTVFEGTSASLDERALDRIYRFDQPGSATMPELSREALQARVCAR